MLKNVCKSLVEMDTLMSMLVVDIYVMPSYTTLAVVPLRSDNGSQEESSLKFINNEEGVQLAYLNQAIVPSEDTQNNMYEDVLEFVEMNNYDLFGTENDWWIIK